MMLSLILFVNVSSSAQTPGNEDSPIDNENAGISVDPDNRNNNKLMFHNFIITIGTEKMLGNTVYQIGYPATEPDGTTYVGYFPFSELEWPLDILLVKIEAAVNIGDSWQINGVLKKDLTDPDDNMKDSDWITSSDPGRLDVYSESDISKFDALIFDFDAEWTFFKNKKWSVYAGFGYQNQKFEYSANLIRQYSPSGLTGFDGYGDGQVGITYEITYSMPYIKIGNEFQFNEELNLEGSLALSPLVNAEDEDNHLLRENGGKIAKGDMEGGAFMIDLSASYKFSQSWFLDGGLQYTYIKVSGDQVQVYGNGERIGTVSEESKSTQTSIYLSAGYIF
jgi:hypothetical protein